MNKKQKSTSSVTMMRIPSFLECFLKISDYLGLTYSEEDQLTSKARIKELKDFDEQGGYMTHLYYGKLINLLAKNNPEYEPFIKHWLEISESTARYLISFNYATLASNKRVLWALLVYVYIPNIACFISFYKNTLKIPSYLAQYDFMLPETKTGKVIYPTERLKKILKRIEKFIEKRHTVKTAYTNTLTQYLHNFNKTAIPQYRTKQIIVDEIKNTKIFDRKIGAIENLFISAIVSGRIFNDLISYFGQESYAIELTDYFKKCLKTFDKYLDKDTDIANTFDELIVTHMELYKFELLLAAHANQYHLSPDLISSHSNKEIENGINERREYVLSLFDAFLSTTRQSDSDKLEVIETEKCQIGMFRCRLPIELEPKDADHKDIIELLSDLYAIFSSPEDVLDESEISQLLGKFRKHKLYSIYEHLYLYYDGLNKLGMNDLQGAKISLGLTLEKCSAITAGETQLEAAYTLIILRLLTEKNTSYSQLNKELTVIMNLEPIVNVLCLDIDRLDLDKKTLEFNIKEESRKVNKFENETRSYKALSKEANLARISTRIKCFNKVGYCHYPSVEPYIYNPFSKVDSLISDIYSLLNESNHLSTSKGMVINEIISKLMKGRRSGNDPYYAINKNLVTLHSFTAKEVFNVITFSSIADFCSTANIDCPNIIRLKEDAETLSLISQAINNSDRPRS